MGRPGLKCTWKSVKPSALLSLAAERCRAEVALAEASEEHQKAANVSASRATTVFAAAEIRAACDGFSSKKLIGRGVRYPAEDTVSKRVKTLPTPVLPFVQSPVVCGEHNHDNLYPKRYLARGYRTICGSALRWHRMYCTRGDPSTHVLVSYFCSSALTVTHLFRECWPYHAK